MARSPETNLTETVTMNNITRTKRNAEMVTGKILVTCKVTIDGLGTHSGTGEEWADEDNAMTSAEAQAFKRACSCFGLGRYFYYFDAPWVDIDEKGPAEEGTLRRTVDGSRQLAQGSTAVGKSGSEFAAGRADEQRFERSRYLDYSEHQQRTSFRNQ
jgi:hypothetical protein